MPPLSKPQTRTLKTRAYDLTKVKKSKKWLKNILLEKSDSSDDDVGDNNNNNRSDGQPMNDGVADMLRFHKLSKNTKREFESGEVESPTQYRQYSTSLLPPSSGPSLMYQVSPSVNNNASMVSLNYPMKPVKKALTPTPRPKPKKKLPPAPPFPNEVKDESSVAGPSNHCDEADGAKPLLVPKLEPEEKVITSSANLASIIDSVASNFAAEPETDTKPLTNVPIKVDPDAAPVKLEPQLSMDEIVYDTCLPEEILQTESPALSDINNQPSSCTSITDDIVYSNQLPDEIFDTEEEESSASAPVTVSTGTSISLLPKSATAPTTPTQTSPASSPAPSSSSLSLLGPKKSVHKSGALKKERDKAKDEASAASRRKRLWVACIRKVRIRAIVRF